LNSVIEPDLETWSFALRGKGFSLCGVESSLGLKPAQAEAYAT